MKYFNLAILYNWFKVFHIVGAISWFAGIFCIWRLLIYHAESESTDAKETLALIERKFYKQIMIPAMFLTILFGSLLLWIQWSAFYRSIWVWLKIFIVMIASYLHFLSNYYRRKLLVEPIVQTKKIRLLNEVPTILLFFIVILVILKPF